MTKKQLILKAMNYSENILDLHWIDTTSTDGFHVFLNSKIGIRWSKLWLKTGRKISWFVKGT